MEKLDQLARVLGIIVTSELSLVSRPLEKGRPSRLKGNKMTTMTKLARKEAKIHADRYAIEATENYFSSRRGVWFIKDLDHVLIYNNNPYNLLEVRQHELKRIEAELKEIGMKVVARGEAGEPLLGTKELYTQTLLVECGEDRIDDVYQIVGRAAGAAHRELCAALSKK